MLEILGYGLDFEYNWYIHGPYSPPLTREMYLLRDAAANPATRAQIDDWLARTEADAAYRNELLKTYLPSSEDAIQRFIHLRDELKAFKGLLTEVELFELAGSLLYLNRHLRVALPSLKATLFNYKEQFKESVDVVEKVIGLLGKYHMIN
jgi:uncharacterized protein YwgA